MEAGELGERTKQAYREIFNLAKDDLLAAAAKKAGEGAPTPSSK